jgi:hypothetical protein
MCDLISCDNCGVVLVNKFNIDSKADRIFQDGQESIFKFLQEKKYTIYSYWADLEQTKRSFIKWCPICKEVKYFCEVDIHGNNSLK